MRAGTFIAEIENRNKIALPPEIQDRLELKEGDKVEILLKKIKSKRFEVMISKNPLYKILNLADSKG